MRETIRLAAGLILVFPLVACEKSAEAKGVAAFTPQDSSAVRVEIEKWRTTLLAQDFNKWGTSVTSDVVMYPPNQQKTVGRDAAVAFVTAYPKITKFDIEVDELGGQGDLAYDRGTYTITAIGPNNATINDKGSFLSTFRRQPDGTWPHSRVMWHSDLPVPTEPATKPATPATRTKTKG